MQDTSAYLANRYKDLHCDRPCLNRLSSQSVQGDMRKDPLSTSAGPEGGLSLRSAAAAACLELLTAWPSASTRQPHTVTLLGCLCIFCLDNSINSSIIPLMITSSPSGRISTVFNCRYGVLDRRAASISWYTPLLKPLPLLSSMEYDIIVSKL